MDEIGLMFAGVKHGFIHLVEMGDADARILPGQEVIVHGRQDLPGLVASTPPHLLKAAERHKVTPLEQLWVDVGLSARQVERLVRVGDLVSLRRSVLELKNGLLAGKAFDNRASVAAVAVCLEQLQRAQQRWDVLAVATVQEEIDLLGAATSAFALQPDVAIAIDVTFATQHNADAVETFVLDKGPTINVGPNMHPGRGSPFHSLGLTKMAKPPRKLSLVKLKKKWAADPAIKKTAFFKDQPLVFIGEIPNMPEHGVFAGKRSGKVYSGLHIAQFTELSEDDI